LRKFDEALRDGQAARELNPERHDAPHLLGKVYSELRDFPKALDYLTESNKLAPAHLASLVRRAVALYHLKNVQEAIRDFEAAIDQHPNVRESFPATFIIIP
jgi:tetratricopeptide (TPR) repeat protein